MCSELELVETPDLIKELLCRSTFAGLILYSPEQHLCDNQLHQEFHLITTTTTEETERLLSQALDIVRQA
jgi:hypothetical protein